MVDDVSGAMGLWPEGRGFYCQVNWPTKNFTWLHHGACGAHQKQLYHANMLHIIALLLKTANVYNECVHDATMRRRQMHLSSARR